MFRPVAVLLFRMLGWRIEDHRPKDLGPCIYVVAPHSSNWDFLFGVLARSIARIDHVRYLAKKELFRPPFGWFFRALGGYPVDRTKRSDVVGQVVAYFRDIPGFAIAITPEGTRRQVDKWRTGFYHIAVQAQVPLILSSIDYRTKCVTFREPFIPTGDLERDVAWMVDYFSRFSGKNRPARHVSLPMFHRFRSLFLSICLPVLTVCGQQPFPELAGETATGRVLTLPSGLQGRPAVIGLAVGKAAKAQLEEWYEPAYLRFVAKHGLFAGAIDAQVLFVPLFVGLNKAAYEPSLKRFRASATPDVVDLVLFCKAEVEALRAALGPMRPDTPYFFVLDAQGRIVHREEGAFSVKKLDALEEALW